MISYKMKKISKKYMVISKICLFLRFEINEYKR